MKYGRRGRRGGWGENKGRREWGKEEGLNRKEEERKIRVEIPYSVFHI